MRASPARRVQPTTSRSGPQRRRRAPLRTTPMRCRTGNRNSSRSSSATNAIRPRRNRAASKALRNSLSASIAAAACTTRASCEVRARACSTRQRWRWLSGRHRYRRPRRKLPATKSRSRCRSATICANSPASAGFLVDRSRIWLSGAVLIEHVPNHHQDRPRQGRLRKLQGKLTNRRANDGLIGTRGAGNRQSRCLWVETFRSGFFDQPRERACRHVDCRGRLWIGKTSASRDRRATRRLVAWPVTYCSRRARLRSVSGRPSLAAAPCAAVIPGTTRPRYSRRGKRLSLRRRGRKSEGRRP